MGKDRVINGWVNMRICAFSSFQMLFYEEEKMWRLLNEPFD